MRRKLVAAGVLALLTPGIQAIIASPAQADSCINSLNWASTTAGNSEVFNASIGCGGVWALEAWTQSDYLLGQYKKDGAWHSSTYGWVWVPKSPNMQKIIGNTVDGRSCRGVAYSYAQDFYLTY